MYISDLHDEDLEIAVKVVIVGNGAVGKSSLIQRYCRGVYTKAYKKTIGVDFLEKHLRVSGEDVRLMLWDTAGQEEFDAITKAYYRGAQACVIAFSTTDRASFEAVKKWKKKVEDECGGLNGIPMVLVQNKIDLMHQSVVSNEEVDRLARECRMRLYRTSVKEDINVGGLFQHLAENYVNKLRSSPPPTLQIQIGGHIRTPPPLRTSIGSTGSNSSGHSSISHFSISPQEYLANPMFDSLNDHNRRKSGFNRYWLHNINHSSDNKTISLKPLVVKRTRSLQRKLPPIKNGCRVI
eukprot:08251.XXX_226882_232903_1 [CDS] Oithona nana genome sequencing.